MGSSPIRVGLFLTFLQPPDNFPVTYSLFPTFILTKELFYFSYKDNAFISVGIVRFIQVFVESPGHVWN